jgi:hypothetical protein
MTKKSTTEQDCGWEAARVAQLRAALRMTPAERLEWLEETNASMRELVGLARTRGRPIGEVA